MSPQRPRDAPRLCTDNWSEETPRHVPDPQAAERDGAQKVAATGGWAGMKTPPGGAGGEPGNPETAPSRNGMGPRH
ncbi:hypothetical protein GCM10009753_32260 [Streptantibioticus ferralitis]